MWETLVSFLISQQNNIVRIRRCIDNLCERYGERRLSDGGRMYCGFPGPEALERHYRRGFPRRRYKGILGVMQQYIFYYELHGVKG